MWFALNHLQCGQGSPMLMLMIIKSSMHCCKVVRAASNLAILPAKRSGGDGDEGCLIALLRQPAEQLWQTLPCLSCLKRCLEVWENTVEPVQVLRTLVCQAVISHRQQSNMAGQHIHQASISDRMCAGGTARLLYLGSRSAVWVVLVVLPSTVTWPTNWSWQRTAQALKPKPYQAAVQRKAAWKK